MADALNLNTNYSEHVVTEEGIQSSRRFVNIKNKFALFMKRNDPQSKFIRNVKKNSCFSNNSSNMSEDLINEFGYMKTSIKSDKKRSIKNETNKYRFSLNDQINLLPIFENKINKKATESISNNNGIQSRKRRVNNASKIERDNSDVEYFSICNIDKNNAEVGIPLDNTEDNLNTYVNNLPQFVKEDLLINSNLQIKKNEHMCENINKLYKQLYDDRNTIITLKNKQKKLLDELKELKGARNKLIADKSLLINELEYVTSYHSSVKLGTDRSNPIQGQIVTTRKSSMGASSIYSDTHSEFDSAIDEIENKISLLKLENSKFFENIDFLNDDFVENEEINKNLKIHLKQLDKNIEALMKERANLRTTYSKLFPNDLGKAVTNVVCSNKRVIVKK